MITDFIFDGKSLSEFGYVIYYDGIQDEEVVASVMDYETIKSPNSDISQKTSTMYEENYSKTLRIMKSDCSNSNDDFYLTNDDVSELTRWLVRKEYKKLMFINFDDTTDETVYYVQNKVSKAMYGDNCVGLIITFTSNAPYGFKPNKITNWDTTEPLKIYLSTDEEGYIYPDMEIKCKESGNLEILNNYENRTMVIKNVKKGEVINITGGNVLQITSSNKQHQLSKDFNYNFLRLCNRYGEFENIIECNLNCSIAFEYIEIRKVGM